MRNIEIVLLHGLGGDRNSMLPVGRRLCRRLPGGKHLSVEGDYRGFPTGKPELGWFYPPTDSDRRVHVEGRGVPTNLDAALKRVHAALDLLVDAGTPADNIFLVGHSQGGAMAMVAGLTYRRPLGGVCSIAGYLVLPAGALPAPQPTPYFLQHANQDPIVTVRWAHYAAQYLADQQLSCELRCWDLDQNPHAIDPRMVDAISGWICSRRECDAA